MRLVELRIHSLPGIQPGFALTELAPGVNVVTGPNASGKSSILRAISALLFEEELRGQAVFVEGVFDDDGVRLQAQRVGDKVHWSREGEPWQSPPLPDRSLLSCYTIRLEDLTAAGEAEKEIARRIARDLSGGYDLAAVRESDSFKVGPQLGRHEQKQLAAAGDELRKVQQERGELHRQEQRLAEVARLKAASEAAADEAEALSQALELLGVRRRQMENQLEIASLPRGMDLLYGDEQEKLLAIRRAADELEVELAGARMQREGAGRSLKASGLGGSDLDDGHIQEARAKLQKLQKLESEADQLDRERVRGEEALESARAQLSSDDERQEYPKLDPAAIRMVEEGLARKRLLESRWQRLKSEIDGLPGEPGPGPGLEALRTARHELLTWLSAAGAARWTGRRIVGLMLLVLAFAIALSTAATLAPSPTTDGFPAPVAQAGTAAKLAAYWLATLWGISGLPLGLLLLSLAFLLGLYLMQRPSRAERRKCRKSFERTAAPSPESWREDDVRVALDRLSEALTEAEHIDLMCRRRAGLERELAGVDEDLASTRAPLAQLAEQVGFDPERLDASFERWLRLVRQYDLASEELGRALAGLALTRQRVAALVTPLQEFLSRHGEAPQIGQAGSSEFQTRLAGLEGRLKARDQALRTIFESEDRITRLADQLEAQRLEVGSLFRSRGLAGMDEPAAQLELRDRLEKLGRWRELSQQRRDLEVEERLLGVRLNAREDLLALVAANDEQRLEAERRNLLEEAGRRDGYADEITQIRERIAAAESERKLERLRAARQQAEDELTARLEQALFAEAGTFLLESVESEHVAASRPETLRTAEEWFETFTRHRYKLRFDPSTHPGFRAWETGSGQGRALDELSTGTKAQLLLAVRVAFALQAEQGRKSLPLFLDEALTTADPERFRAVAESLRLLADAGRQVFYLTARAEDGLFWQSADSPPPAMIDIARVREQGQAISDPALLDLPQRRAVPEPGRESAAEYGMRLSVPAVDPWGAADAVHIFHLLRDDLELLHGLLDSGVDRLGVLKSFLASDAAQLRLNSAEQLDLEWRCLAAEAWFEGWRVGRGRPVDRRALEDSEAVSATFIERVDKLARELSGDGEQLIGQLAAGAVKGFQRNRRELLEEWFLERGFLDDRAVLTPEELRLRVSSTLARSERTEPAEGVDLLELAAMTCERLQAAVRAGAGQLGR